jgi:hypothetical protein
MAELIKLETPLDRQLGAQQGGQDRLALPQGQH